ncbi:plant UBX domain-containing protein 10-like [Dioscorea cayenensis subsp. rotundata]|uniref:Plant UBX domain-containing protein 10-like n=1 Tax=Dioscorea cayennensis subsp. rotundata TaxID=55577 RepID=A0AB40BR84_DIOCR|nr:plant UBX domain-containing protein 10-like [Dioscorea cayenensis subsp. rotundata]
MTAMENMGSFIRRIVGLPLNILDGISRALGHGIPRRNARPPQLQQPQDEIPIVTEEWLFLNLFEQQYGSVHPFFYATRLMEALKMAKDESKFVFIYLHAPEETGTDPFCCNTLRSQLVIEFLDANFVSWGAVANRGEGFEMAFALRASSFPFCAVIAPASCKTIAVLQQIEGPVSPEELLEILQRTMEEQGSAFRALREAEDETLRRDRQLREEQDAAYLESLKKDKEKDRAWEPKRKAPALKKSSVKQKEVTKDTQSTAVSRKTHTKILVRFPNGERREQSFPKTDKIHSIYKYIDSLDIPGIGGYQLISSFPRKVYGHEQLEMTLEEAGLHPNTALFLELI